MNGSNQKNPIILIGVVAIAAVVSLCIVLFQSQKRLAVGPASEAIVADFFTSLAALDVEENGLAVETLSKAVKAIDTEPALFANLALGQLRNGDVENAHKNILEALKLERNSKEISTIYAEILNQSGDRKGSIEQLELVRKEDPKNVRLTHAIVDMLSNMQTENSDAICLQYMKEILQVSPENVLALCGQARFAVSLKDKSSLDDAITSLDQNKFQWSQEARDQLSLARTAASTGDFSEAGIALTRFRNVIVKSATYQTSREELEGTSSSVGTPIRKFLKLTIPKIDIEKADMQLAYEIKEPAEWKINVEGKGDLLVAFPRIGDGARSALLLASGGNLANQSSEIKFPGSTSNISRASIQMVDLNWDFRQDIVACGDQGCVIYLQQEDESFSLHSSDTAEFSSPWKASWAFDVDADGDLDLLLSDLESPLKCFINDGQAHFKQMSDFTDVKSVQQMQFFDVDLDGDVDMIALNSVGEIIACMNERSSKFSTQTVTSSSPSVAIAAACLANDARIELVALSNSGVVEVIRLNDANQWKASELVKWDIGQPIAGEQAALCRLWAGDLDNNGAPDLVASVPNQSQVWLADPSVRWQKSQNITNMRVDAVLDINDDGMLDLIGVQAERGKVAIGRGNANYQWQEIEPLAKPNAGDKRINTVGLGGRIELRSGYQLQLQTINSPRIHFGLGKHTLAEVARIVWPNGTSQSEFSLAAREKIVAVQRLKGSCPWVFAFNGNEFQFTKDFLWRSPLGLRINAQETAGITQTEDWIKISGDQLKEDSGKYKFRISAELWETHFVDYVDLMVVDHPSDTYFFIDERFNPRRAQSQEKFLLTKPKSLVNVHDDQGKNLDEAVEKIDGRYADSFALGPYQGLAESHFVEFELPDDIDWTADIVILGHAWLYPTDSSVNVAISQRNDLNLHGLILEQQNESGNWVVIDDDLGFPGGKNKDMVLVLKKDAITPTRPLRLRTNMEVYWDYLGWAYRRNDVSPTITSVNLSSVDLRYRGYSKIEPVNRRRPDTPYYQVEATSQRWLDLQGFYTRFGAVQELLSHTDDRYVIMNAGDELAIEFNSLTPVAEGMTRDYILIGDGWVKDGDLNTAYSRTVLPLPTHQSADYAGPLLPLDQDPIYLKHKEDWERYHTRYVSPRSFQNKLASKTRENLGEESK